MMFCNRRQLRAGSPCNCQLISCIVVLLMKQKLGITVAVFKLTMALNLSNLEAELHRFANPISLDSLPEIKVTRHAMSTLRSKIGKT